MSTELSRVATPRQLTLPTREIARLVDIYFNHIERETWNTSIITVEIPPKDRMELSARLCHIEAACVPKTGDSAFERSRIDTAVSFMIGMFMIGRKVSEKEADDTVDAYRVALDGVPAIFIERACEDFIKGRVADHDKAYCPNCAQVRVHAEELMAPFREEAAKIRMIISSKKRIKPTKEEHERMLAKVRAVIDGTDPDLKAIRDRVEADRQVQRERHAIEVGRANEIQRRRYCEHYGVDPDGLASPALMQKLYGLMTPKAQPEKKKAGAKGG